MTSETGSLASEIPLKMPSAEAHLGSLKDGCGDEVAHAFPEESQRFNQEKLSGVRIPDTTQLEMMCKTGDRNTWWEWYNGRYSGFFERANGVDPLTLQHNYLDCDSVSLSNDGEEIDRDLHTVTGAPNGNVAFPGPLVRGETDHIAVYRYILTELQRCLSDDSMEDKEGAVMVWRLLALMWRKNGMVSGKDVAMLLLQQLHAAEYPDSRTVELDLIELLVSGKKQEALNLAVEKEYWEHALILDSFFRKASCVPSIIRFINSLDDGDLMKTFYEVFLGKIPGVIAKCGDMIWREWCPHLAIILSNCACPRQLKDRVTMVADNFGSKGQLWSAHFCYMAIKTLPSFYCPKFILIGQDFSLPFKVFAADTAIERTEVYEYLLALPQGHNCPCFQVCKIMHGWRLFRAGRIVEAFKYSEAVAKFFLATSARPCPTMSRLLELCDALSQKLPDWVEPPWITALKKLADNADREVPSEPEQDSEQPQVCVMEPAENQALDSILDGDTALSRLGPLQDASETQSEEATFSLQPVPCDVGKGESGRSSPTGLGTCEEFKRLSDPVLPEETQKKKKKRSWIRCFAWCGRAEE